MRATRLTFKLREVNKFGLLIDKLLCGSDLQNQTQIRWHPLTLLQPGRKVDKQRASKGAQNSVVGQFDVNDSTCRDPTLRELPTRVRVTAKHDIRRQIKGFMPLKPTESSKLEEAR